MKILVNMYYCHPYNLYQSIPIYIWRFVNSIAPERRKDYMLLFNSADAEQMHLLLPEFEFVSVNIPIKNTILKHIFRSFRALYFKRITDKIKCDVLFNAVDIDLFSYLPSNHKKVIVVHDLKDLKVKNWRVRWLCRRIYGKSLESADKVIAISEFTKNDILKFYPQIEHKKIKVIYNSVPYNNSCTCPLELLEQKKFILSVNTLVLNKNPFTLLKAYNEISKIRPELLVFVGRKTKYWINTLEPYIKENKLTNRVIRLENLSDDELTWLYRHAALFVTASQREGFGYTPIEAAMHCCPVVSSRSEALPDTTREKLYYYDPATNSKALFNRMVSILDSPPDHNTLNDIASYFKKEYSPVKQYEEFVTLFNSIACDSI